MSGIVHAPINAIGLVKEHKLKDQHVFCCSHKTLAREAFKKFLVHRCDVIAIVNEENQIISHISESDIVGVGPEAIHFLLCDEYLTVSDFMNAVNKENDRKMEPVCCKKDAILKNLMQIIVEKQSNHIFVVDDQNKPIQLITLNEIICKFSPYDYKATKTSKRLSMITSANAKQAANILDQMKTLKLTKVVEHGTESEADSDLYKD
eukprot:486187_1